MNKQRGVLRFQKKQARPPLSREEFSYWLDFLPKILKIGTEFEINLPSVENVLQNPEGAPCVRSSKPCLTDCLNLETCLVDRHPTMCLTRSSGKFLTKKFTCPAKDDQDTAACAECPAWALDCRGLECAMHTPYCTICPSFSREGENHVEKGDIRKDAELIREEMKQILQPTGFVGKTGKSGALEVKKDGSLQHNGGIEVPTVGRRVHWNSFYKMCKGIVDPIVERGGFVNERCSQHYHVLTGYFDSGRSRDRQISELESPLPEIILANLHQLHRRYELAMFWIMSAGADMEHLTRWARFRQPIRKFSALHSRMAKIQAEMNDQIQSMTPSQRSKYASVTYYLCKFDEDGNASTFHIENRISDGLLSPCVAAAFAMMCYAFVMKAVRFSQYGIMEIGDQEYCEKLKEIEPHLINGADRGWDGNRHADTSGIGPHIPWLRENAREMIQLLKAELYNLGPSYDILMELAERPISLRLMSGDSWEKIEEDLYTSKLGEAVEGPIAEEEIREIVDLAGIVDCDDVEMWIEEVAANLGQNAMDVGAIIHQMVESGKYRWSPPIGALITAY